MKPFDRPRQGAIIPYPGRYRYLLWRDWDPRRPVVTWIMFNPSTADAYEDDPTIRRCLSFSVREGYGALEVVNLYAKRATNPLDVFSLEGNTSDPALKGMDAIGPENPQYVRDATPLGRDVFCAWGTLGRARSLDDMMKVTGGAVGFWCLGKNKDGSPKHPLYLPKTAPRERFC